VNRAPLPPRPAPAPSCQGKTATIVAKPGKRSITGTPGADVIVGGLVGERIDGGGGDTICGARGASGRRRGLLTELLDLAAELVDALVEVLQPLRRVL
jgi:hypothetical protein